MFWSRPNDPREQRARIQEKFSKLNSADPGMDEAKKQVALLRKYLESFGYQTRLCDAGPFTELTFVEVLSNSGHWTRLQRRLPSIVYFIVIEQLAVGPKGLPMQQIEYIRQQCYLGYDVEAVIAMYKAFVQLNF